MLPSLPLITPRDSHILWYTHYSTFSFDSAISTAHPANPPLPAQAPVVGIANSSTHGSSPRTRNPAISPLAQLSLDEHSVDQRRLNIQRFGATWLRPLGMSKTLQGQLEEAAEQEEAEQQEMVDDVGIVGEATFGLGGNGQMPPTDEPDLDADIPEADTDLGSDGLRPDFLAEADEDDHEEDIDLDADIPEAEVGSSWGDSAEEDGDDEEGSEVREGVSEGDFSADHETMTITSAREGNESFGTEDSPQQAIFSHDETYPEDAVRGRREGYDWRGRAQYRGSDSGNMDLDSDL